MAMYLQERTNLVDKVWDRTDVTVVNSCKMLVVYGVGDHGPFTIDFLTSSLVGHCPQKIIRQEAQRLNTMLKVTTENYNLNLEKNSSTTA